MDMALKDETSIGGRVLSRHLQVGVLSPLVWNIAVDELLEESEGQCCKVV